MSSTSPTPRIAIVGGGPAGLVLLLILRRRGISATLYERDTGFSSRAHLGGTLDLGWDSGQRALRENGLQEQFDKHSRPEGDEFKLCDAAGNILLAQSADGLKNATETRPEIDRSVLRKILLDAVPAHAIKWGHGLVAVRPLEGTGGQHELTFANDVTVVCDVLVGADGANSRVRPLLSSATPLYTGVTGAEVSLAPEVADRADMADTKAVVGHGSLFAIEKSKMLGAQLNGDGRIRTYAWFRGPVDWALPADPAAARGELLKIYEGWAPHLLKLIEHCDDAAIYLRTLYYLPVGHRWDHVPGVTLVGDAAHLMSPFAGVGANLAMLDGLELGLILAETISSGKGVEEREAAVAAWEERMFSSVAVMAKITKENLEAFLNPGAPRTAVERSKAFLAEGRDEAKDRSGNV